MLNFFQRNYYLLVIVAFFLGIIIPIILRNQFGDIWHKFKMWTPIIKSYWIFVIIFTISIVIAYTLIFKLSQPNNLSVHLTVLGQISALIFAIFVGYFAFLQVSINRFEKLEKDAYNYFKSEDIKTAIVYYEQALSLQPKDFKTLGNLMEAYLIDGQYDKFDAKLPLLNKCTLEEYQKISICYLEIAKFLLQKRIGEGQDKIKECIEMIKNNPDLLRKNVWDFSDMQKSELYKKLSGEVKTTFDNFIKYLEKQMDEKQKFEFEGGNFLLNSPTTQV